MVEPCNLKQFNRNGMLLIRSDSNFYFFAALYFALLDLLPCLQAAGTRDCNKGSKSSRAK